MAREENSGLLGEIVNQLKALNKASSTDMLREAEALKRSEKLQQVTETTADFSGIAVNDSKDFQRRFLAGQASTLVNEQRNLKPAREKSLESSKELGKARKKAEELDILQQKEQTKALKETIPNQLYKIGEFLHNLTEVTKYGFGWTQKLFDIWKNEQGPHSFAVHDARTAKQLEFSFAESLKFEEKRANELDMQRRDDIRTRNENRSEKNKVAGSAAAGWGAFGDPDQYMDDGSWGDVDEGFIPDDVEDVASWGIGASLLLNYKKVLGLLGISKYASTANVGKTFSQIWKLRWAAMGAWLTKGVPARALAANKKWGKWLFSGNRVKIMVALIGISMWTMMDSIKAFFGVEGANPHDGADFQNWESDFETEDGFFNSRAFDWSLNALGIAQLADMFFNKNRITKTIGRGIKGMFKGVAKGAMTLAGFIYRRMLLVAGGAALASLGVLSAPAWGAILAAGYVGWKLWQFKSMADELKTLDLPGLKNPHLGEAMINAVETGTHSDGTPLFPTDIDETSLNGIELNKIKNNIKAGFVGATVKGQGVEIAKSKKKEWWDAMRKQGYSAKFLNSILLEMQTESSQTKGDFESTKLRFRRMGLMFDNPTGPALTDTRNMGVLSGQSGNGLIIGKNTALEDNSFHQHLATMIYVSGQQPQTWTNSSIEPFSWYHGNYGTE